MIHTGIETLNIRVHVPLRRASSPISQHIGVIVITTRQQLTVIDRKSRSSILDSPSSIHDKKYRVRHHNSLGLTDSVTTKI